MATSSGLSGQFHLADYVLFSASLAVGLVIGVISWCNGRKQKTSSDYLLGGRDLNVFAVGTSLILSSLNAVFLLGGTAEVYLRGAIYGLNVFTIIPDALIAIFIFIPLWRRVPVTSVYEYLEKRYNSVLLRLWGAFLFTVGALLFLSVVLFTPAMVFSQVTGLNLHISIVACGLVCAIYTTLGGLKAVVWTDCIQAMIMLLGLLVICIMGTVQVGGPTKMFQTANELGRFNFNNLSPDPRVRHTVWTQVIGYSIVLGTGTLSNQVMVQRYMAVKDTRSAQRAMIICYLVFGTCILLVTSVGILTTVYYKDCDPLVAGHITRGDQLLPYFFMDLLGPYPGLPGLFISAIFAAALSTVSSYVNSLAAIFLEDFVKPFVAFYRKPIPSEKENIYAKVLSGIFGVLSIALSYMTPLLGEAIVQITPTISGSIGGPLFSIFFLGFFVRWSHKWGAVGGSIVGLVLSLWINFGAILHGRGAGFYNLEVGQCLSNVTVQPASEVYTVINATTSQMLMEDHPLQSLYDVSYAWSGLIGALSSIIAGLIISAICNLCGHRQDISTLPPELFCMKSTLCSCHKKDSSDHIALDSKMKEHKSAPDNTSSTTTDTYL